MLFGDMCCYLMAGRRGTEGGRKITVNYKQRQSQYEASKNSQVKLKFAYHIKTQQGFRPANQKMTNVIFTKIVNIYILRITLKTTVQTLSLTVKCMSLKQA